MFANSKSVCLVKAFFYYGLLLDDTISDDLQEKETQCGNLKNFLLFTYILREIMFETQFIQ